MRLRFIWRAAEGDMALQLTATSVLQRVCTVLEVHLSPAHCWAVVAPRGSQTDEEVEERALRALRWAAERHHVTVTPYFDRAELDAMAAALGGGVCALEAEADASTGHVHDEVRRFTDEDVDDIEVLLGLDEPALLVLDDDPTDDVSTDVEPDVKIH